MKIKNKIISISLLSTISMTSLGVNSKAMPTTIYSGLNRTETSIKTSAEIDSQYLTIASGKSFADSLSAYNIVKTYKTKLILVDSNTDISVFLQQNKPSKIFLIGGEVALNGNAINQANSYIKTNSGFSIERISGKDRYETNLKTLKRANFARVGVADGRNFPDAISASGLLSYKNLGLRLVDGSKPYSSNGMTNVYTFGGKNAVLQEGGKRLAGKNRYETSRLINNELGTPVKLAVTIGNDFPDALSALNSVVGSGSKTATLIVDKNIKYFTESQAKYAVNAKYASVVGGQVPQGVIDQLKNMPKMIVNYAPFVSPYNPTGVTASKLNQFLKGPCSGKGQLILDLSHKYKQDPAFMVAIMGIETGFGGNIRHTNNPMSVLWNRGSGSSTYPTIEAGIEAGIKNIATNRAYNNCTNLSSFCRVYLGYNNSTYIQRLNTFYKNITGIDAYNVKVR